MVSYPAPFRVGTGVNEWLRRFKESLGCRIHAYCLMTNDIHPVVDPGGQVEGFSTVNETGSGNIRD